MGMFDTVRFRYRTPDGVTGTRTDTCFDGMLTLSADDGYHLYFEHGTLAWIEVYSQGDRRWPFEPGRFMPDPA